MNQPFYEFTPQDNAQTFDFESLGKQIVKKKVLYQNTNQKPFYNLALVDVLEDGSFDDMTESRNGDMEKILATVANTLPFFFDRFPDAIVLFRGSDERRTRLYQILINREVDNLAHVFTFLGINGLNFEKFRKNKTYDGFAIILKKS
ncbi:MAG: hypothetical protein MUF58_07875 [Arcicella sp.]|jgi:hypothetical protein|nr:hypothetical protein [Arcicella sp.]